MTPPFRIGFGYDVHRLVAGRPLFLGGVRLEHVKGCEGHSDADVLLHAICDALLGAVALRDIGYHFPDTDAANKDIDSKIFLKKIVALLKEKGWRIGNIDATVALEKPKLNPHISAMIQTIAPILGVEENCVSIKATTNEKLGYVGSEDGVNAWAVALVYKQ
ncbi:MAG TPA: 2-C-methyl-D-erythritol 2,4-cyclodiphosphate synthase [Bacteroidia bacterium]|nr:2-C-methyl-D-erythritol 2,4-cyclodiphosphate synthase [Bacteroidia bacterium]